MAEARRRISNLDEDGADREALRTYVCFILDESGSMESCKPQVLSGYAEYLSGLRRQVDVFFSLTKFNTTCIAVCVAEPVAQVPDLTTETYVPDGMTALYDSVVDTVGLLETRLPLDGACRVLVVVMTDGQENSSKRATKEQVKGLVTAREARGNWTFVYLGAGPDAWAEAAMMGVAAGNTMTYATSNTGGSFSQLYVATLDYVRSARIGTQTFYGDAGQTAAQYQSGTFDATTRRALVGKPKRKK